MGLSRMADDSALLREARERFQAGIDADRDNRKRDADDRNFYTGGKYQWPAGVPEERQKDGRPCETYNRLPQFVKQVSGEVRQNKPAIKVLPVDGQSDPEIAKIYSAIIRHIESNSDGHRVYAKETEKAVIGGQGWWRILADYCDDEGFDQELKIEGIPNPCAVVCDPDAKQPTRSDMEWGFVTQMMSDELFETKNPNISKSDFDNLDDAARTEWVQGDKVRIAEYWRKADDGKRKLYALQMPSGQVETHNEDDLRTMLGGAKGDVAEMLYALDVTIKAERTVTKQKVESILLCGAGKLGDWQAWPGKYIPLVRVVGEEVEAGDSVFRHGMIHHAIPPQRSYNFARNAMMERHSTSTKSPWLVTAKQIANYKGLWETANTKNHAALIYDPDPLAPPPTRNAPPQLDAAAYQESQIASEDMKATTGIYDAALGAKSNETSGIAIARRDAQGDTATYVYIDNMEAAITHTGRIFIDLIPHYYSNERVIRMIGEDNEVEKFEQINKLMPDGKTWNDISRGKFDVVVTTGPAYATKRQEAAENMLKLAQVEGVAAVGGDIIVRALDLPMGDKLADRMQKMLPKGIDEEVDKKRQEAEQQQGPPQPDPMQQAQQQAMQIDLATKEALARKADADAQKAEAEAMKAVSEVQAIQSGEGDRELQIRIQEISANLQMKREEMEAKLQMEREKMSNDMQMAQQKQAFDFQLADRKATVDEQVATRRAEREDFTASHKASQQDSREG